MHVSDHQREVVSTAAGVADFAALAGGGAARGEDPAAVSVAQRKGYLGALDALFNFLIKKIL